MVIILAYVYVTSIKLKLISNMESMYLAGYATNQLCMVIANVTIC